MQCRIGVFYISLALHFLIPRGIFMEGKVAVIMGSISDMSTMGATIDILKELQIPYEVRVISAHRTPELMFDFAKKAKICGIKIIIAGAGGAAHLPGMVASLTTLPVIGVPVQSKTLKGIDSLLSIVQMPGGIPVATVAIGEAGAKNAGLLAGSILALENIHIADTLEKYRENMKKSVLLSSEVSL